MAELPKGPDLSRVGFNEIAAGRTEAELRAKGVSVVASDDGATAEIKAGQYRIVLFAVSDSIEKVHGKTIVRIQPRADTFAKTAVIGLDRTSQGERWRTVPPDAQIFANVLP